MTWWGRSVSVNLKGCDPDLIRSPAALRRFVRELCEKIDMKRVGRANIKRFGKGSLRGYSLMQFIETSSITAHFDEVGSRAFIDIFSCRRFNARSSALFSKRFFRAEGVEYSVFERR